jgi:membrane protein
VDDVNNAPSDGRRAGTRAAAARQHYTRLRDRVEASTPGQVRRRVRELDIMNHALILASLSLTLLIPALVTTAAFLPVGSKQGLMAGAVHRLGLNAAAARDLRELFPSKHTVTNSTTVVSAVATVFFAIGWPAELGRGYQAIWRLPARGIRDLWRTVAWLVSFFIVLGFLTSVGRLVSGTGGAVLTGLIALPVSFGWCWWGQYVLLSGRVGWRALLPGAVTTSLLLFGFSLAMHVYLPYAIVENFDKYGPIGVVMALLSWIIGFSAVMLGGPLVGHFLYTRRHGPAPMRSGGEDAELPGAPDRLVPP